MLNLLSLLFSLMVAPPPRKYAAAPAVCEKSIVVPHKKIQPRTSPASYGDVTADESFGADEYALKKQELDKKYARRAYLREKMVAELADFLADYEEYSAISKRYSHELRALTGEFYGEAALAPRPYIPDEESGKNEQSEGEEGEVVQPGDGTVPRPMPPQPRLPEKGEDNAGGSD